MDKSESENFKLMMNTMFALYGKRDPANEVLRVWWIKLAKFDFAVISKAFDNWTDTKPVIPTPADILPLCQHKVLIFAKLPSPLEKAENKRHADEVVNFIAAHTAKKKDMHSWAKRILTRPHRFPQGSIDAAKKLLGDYQPTAEDLEAYAT
jgi:hypothetical protein